LRKSLFSIDEIRHAIDQLEKSGRAVIRGEIVADTRFWRSLRDRTIGLIEAEHRHRPERLGIDVSQLRSADISPEVFDALVADLCSDGFIRSGVIIARNSHRPTLPERLRVAGAKLRAILSAKSFDPPPRTELAPDSESQQALRFLITTGEAVEVASDSVMLADSFQQMKNTIVDLLAQRGAATTSELRQALGTTRRVLIPLLEHLDRNGVTRREGERRKLRSS
jgi:selenocysteine-specific elongation factor